MSPALGSYTFLTAAMFFTVTLWHVLYAADGAPQSPRDLFRAYLGVALWPILLAAALIYAALSLCYVVPVSLIRNQWVAWPHQALRGRQRQTVAQKKEPPPSDPYLEAATKEVEQLLH